MEYLHDSVFTKIKLRIRVINTETYVRILCISIFGYLLYFCNYCFLCDRLKYDIVSIFQSMFCIYCCSYILKQFLSFVLVFTQSLEHFFKECIYTKF